MKAVLARPRLLISALLGLVVFLALGEVRFTTRFLLAWDGAAALALGLIGVMIARSDHQVLQRRADDEDAGAVVVLVLAILASVASLGAIGAELHGIKDASGPGIVGPRLVLVGSTILLSWLFVHAMFALHYAHDFYAGEDDRGGLAFPGDDKPDYWDFLYFSFTIGAAAQTSDVSVPSPRMRRFVLAHTIVSFLFNTTILALAINVGAGLL